MIHLTSKMPVSYEMVGSSIFKIPQILDFPFIWENSLFCENYFEEAPKTLLFDFWCKRSLPFPRLLLHQTLYFLVKQKAKSIVCQSKILIRSGATTFDFSWFSNLCSRFNSLNIKPSIVGNSSLLIITFR